MQAPDYLSFFSQVSPRYARFMPCGKAHLVNPYQLVGFWFGEMAPLKFICPATGNEVDTGIDVDPQSFAGLPRDTISFSCPHCDEPHVLAGVQAWLGDVESANTSNARLTPGPRRQLTGTAFMQEVALLALAFAVFPDQ